MDANSLSLFANLRLIELKLRNAPDAVASKHLVKLAARRRPTPCCWSPASSSPSRRSRRGSTSSSGRAPWWSPPAMTRERLPDVDRATTAAARRDARAGRRAAARRSRRGQPARGTAGDRAHRAAAAGRDARRRRPWPNWSPTTRASTCSNCRRGVPRQRAARAARPRRPAQRGARAAADPVGVAQRPARRVARAAARAQRPQHRRHLPRRAGLGQPAGADPRRGAAPATRGSRRADHRLPRASTGSPRAACAAIPGWNSPGWSRASPACSSPRHDGNASRALRSASSAARSTRSTSATCARRSRCCSRCACAKSASCPPGDPPHRDAAAGRRRPAARVRARGSRRPARASWSTTVRCGAQGRSYSVLTLQRAAGRMARHADLPDRRHGRVPRPADLAPLGRTAANSRTWSSRRGRAGRRRTRACWASCSIAAASRRPRLCTMRPPGAS